MKACIRTLEGRLRQLPPPILTGLGLCYVLLVLAADQICLARVSFTLFYLAGAAFVGWLSASYRRTAVVSVAAAAALAFQELTRGGAAAHEWITAWNVAARTIAYLGVGWLSVAVSRLTLGLEHLVEDRTAQWKTEAAEHKATAGRLAEALERFEQVVNNIGEVFWLSDRAKSHLIYVSPGYEQIWGRTCEELYREPKSWLAGVHPADRETVSRRAETEQAAGGYDVEYRVVRPDGAIRWIRDQAFPVRNAAGEVCRIAGLARDITERHQAHEAWRMQAAILESMAEAVVVTDDQGVILQVNPAAERIWGYGAKEMVGQPADIFSALTEPERSAKMQEVLAALRDTSSWRGTFKNRRKDGSIIHCDAVMSRLELPGRVLYVALEQDVTERARTEEALRQSEESLRVFIEGLGTPALLMDSQGTVQVSNATLADRLGLRQSEVRGRDIFSLLPAQVAATRKARFEEIIRTRKAVQFEDEDRGWHFLNVASPVFDGAGNVARVAVVALDITERKRAEQIKDTLLSLGTKLSTAQSPAEAARAAFAAADEFYNWDTAVLDLFSPATETMRHVLCCDVIDGRRCELPLEYPDEPVTPRMRRILREGPELILRQPPYQPPADARMVGDVSRPSASIMSVPVRLEDHAIGVLSVQSYQPDAYTEKDLPTLQALADHCAGALERLRAEEALQQREQLNRAILASAMDGYYILDFGADPLGAFVEANAAFCRMTGYTREELLRMRIADVEAVESPEEVGRHVEKLMAHGGDRFETRHRRKDGREVALEICISLLPGKPGGVFGFVRDITARKQAERTREVFLSLGEKLGAAQSPIEAARIVYAAADQLWGWDSATMSLCSAESDAIEPVLFVDVLDGQRREVSAALPGGVPTARMRRVMQQGPELILRREGEPPDPETVRYGDVSRASASLMCVPFRREGRSVGFLSIQSYRQDAFTAEDLRTLVGLADYCGAALERIQAEEALRQREELLRAFYDSPGALRGVIELLEDDLLVLSANLPQAQAYGRIVEQMRLARASELRVSRDTIDLWREKCHESALANSPITFEYSSDFRAPGTWGLAMLSPLRTPHGARPRFAYIASDITERKRAELMKDAFLSLGSKLSAAQNPAEAARAVFAAADKLWKWDSASLDLYSPEADCAEAVLNCDVVEGLRREVATADPRGAPSPRMRRVMEHGGELILEAHPTQTSDFKPFGDTSRLSASMMYVPLRREGRAVGVLSIHSYTSNAYTPENLRTLQALADYCGGALERIQAESALRENEQRLRMALEATSMVTWEWDIPAGRIRYSANTPAVARGDAIEPYCSVDGLIQEVHPDDRAVLTQAMQRTMSEGSPYECEYRVRMLDGAYRWISGKGAIMERTEGKPVRAAGISQDITDRKRAEQALGESEERYRSLVNNLNVGVYRNQPSLHGGFIQANPALARMHGYDSVEEFLKVKVQDLYQCPGEREAFLAELRRQGSLQDYELRLKRKDGTPIYVSVNATAHWDPAGELVWIDGVLEDITRRRQAEAALREAHGQLEQRVRERTAELQAANAALRESEARLGMALDASGAGTWSWEATNSISTWDDRYNRLYGFEPEAPRSHEGWLSRVHPEDRQKLLTRIQTLLEPGAGDVWHEEFRALHPALGERWMEGLGRVQRDETGRAVRLTGINLDITERNRMERALREAHDRLEQRVRERTAELEVANAALRESEERYRTLAESSPDAIFILDRAGRVRYGNSAAAALWKCPPQGLIGRCQAELFSPKTARSHQKVVEEVFETGRPVRRDEPITYPIGDQWVEVRLAPLYDGAGKIGSVMGISRDITERKRAERELAEALDLNQRILAASPMGIEAFKASGECVFANQATCRIVGGTLPEILRRNFRRLPSWRRAGLLQLAERALATRQPQVMETHWVSSFGREVWADLRLAPFKRGGELHLLCMYHDVSERKHVEAALREAERLREAILDNIPDPAWLKDAKGYFRAGNQALVHFYGQPLETIVGKRISDFAPHEADRVTREDEQVIRKRRPLRAQAFIAQPHGQARWFEIIKSPLYGQGGEVTGTVGIARDISDYKRSEILLRAQRDLGVGLSQTSDLPTALKHLLGVAMQLGGVDSGGVYLLDPTTGGMDLVAHRGASAAFIKAVSHWAADSSQMRLVRRGRPIFSLYSGLPLPHDDARRREGLRGSAFIPLSHEGKPIGALTLASNLLDEIPRPTQLALEALAAQAAGAIARIRAETDRRRLEQQLLEISDRQQARIGQEIHDGLCQHLVSLAFDANSLHRALSGARRPEAKSSRRIAHYLDQAITEARQLSRGLFPALPHTTGLPPALAELARVTAARFKLGCRFTSRGPVVVTDPASATHLYRIAQEAVANATKHSQARNVSIRLRANANQLELSVEDDGRGLAATRRNQASGLGLHIMDYRARAMGGTFRLRRSRRGGTLVSCCVPRKNR